jgi:hypothetical protein
MKTIKLSDLKDYSGIGVSFEYTGKCWSLCTIPVVKTEGLNKGYLIHA